MSIKPKLYNGLLIARKYKTKVNLVMNSHYEIYALADDQKLILFINLSPDLIAQKFKLMTTFLGQEQYYYSVVSEETNVISIERQIEKLLNPRGFGAVVGMEDVKELFIQDIIYPIKNKEKYDKFKVALPNAILLFGPPGCGKTYFIEKLAEELNFEFIRTSPSNFGSTYIHGTSLKIKEIFDDAKAKAPSILFIDEIDSIFPKRKNLGSESNYKQEEINEFLVQINNIASHNVIVIAATNQPSLLDEALLRTGRIDKMVYIGLPDKNTRIELFKFYLRNRPTKNIDYDSLGDISKGYNNSDINYVCNEASKSAINLNQEHITTNTLVEVINRTSPSVSDEQIEDYAQFSIKERK